MLPATLALINKLLDPWKYADKTKEKILIKVYEVPKETHDFV